MTETVIERGPYGCDGGYACVASEHIEGCFTGEGDPEAVKGLYVVGLHRQLAGAVSRADALEAITQRYAIALQRIAAGHAHAAKLAGEALDGAGGAVGRG